MRNTVILILGLLTIIHNSYGQNEYFNRFLSINEIETINEIVNQFDSILIKRTGQESITTAYLDFSSYLKQCESPKDFHDRVFSLKPDIDTIIKKNKDTEFFKNTWKNNHGFKYPNVNDTLNVFLELRPKSNYLNLLKKKKRKSELLKFYWKHIEPTYTLFPILYGETAFIMDSLDTEIEENRLIIAIHFITLLSTTEKKPAVNNTYRQ